ncbi:ribosome biogenesis GTPase Der, partial [Sulfurospirillum cavolei]|uniref:ribosome biogenesis GTPase Der n=1 Tax=Sulfurospirillum cavolei TaxID=366522 RepID=UPI003FA306C3
INKIDNDKEMERAWEFSEFGAENVFAISVSHNRGVSALLEWIAAYLPTPEGSVVSEASESDEEDEDEDWDEEDDWNEEEGLPEAIEEETVPDNRINVAIIGRVNVGKSSLLNALVGKQRAVVSSIEGRTTDPVDEAIEYNEKIINFVDTAGLRRGGKIEGIEKFALMRTKEMLERANIALLVLDASEPFKELDERIAGLVEENNLACIIVLNKWDKANVEYEEIMKEVRERFKFLSYAPLISVSALTKQRVSKIKEMLLSVYENYAQRIPTARLNEVIKEATIKHQIPSDHAKVVKIYFATQYQSKPPRIVLVMNKPRSLHFSYRRYLANRLRDTFNLEGTPILIYPRAKGEKDEQNEQDDA